MEDKTCTGCGITKPVEEFYRRKTGAPVQPCKECQKERAREKRIIEGPKPMDADALEKHAEKMRRLRDQEKQADPDGYRARRAAYQRAWRARKRAEGAGGGS